MSGVRGGVAGDAVTPPDIVYIVRDGDFNEELAYSLRSIVANLTGFGRIWIFGHTPWWVQGVESVSVAQGSDRFVNVRALLGAIAAEDRLSDEILLWYDDVFVIESCDARTFPAYHVGDGATYVEGRTGSWADCLRETCAWVASRGVDALAYCAHTPKPLDRRRLAAVLAAYPADAPVDQAGIYPLCGSRGVGVRAGNAKCSGLSREALKEKLALDMPFLSTGDAAFARGAAGEFIRSMFPERSRYEVEGGMVNVYDVVIAGVTHRLQLDDEGARMRGIVPYSERAKRAAAVVNEKAAEPKPNKARIPGNKQRGRAR